MSAVPIILYAVTLHLVWAFTLMVDRAANGATAIHPVQALLHPPYARWVFFGVAITAFYGLFVKNRKVAATCMVPQQIVLFWSAGGAIVSILTGTFADGTVRSSAFILVDQAPAILAAIYHTVAIWLVAKGKAPWIGH